MCALTNKMAALMVYRYDQYLNHEFLKSKEVLSIHKNPQEFIETESSLKAEDSKTLRTHVLINTM